MVDIEASAEQAVYLNQFSLTCNASLNPKVASHLIRYLVLDWVGADGQSVSEVDGVTIGEQQFYSLSNTSNTTTRDLVFDPLVMAHGGDYRCEAKLILPDNAGSFNTTLDYHINVMSMYYTPCFKHLFITFSQPDRTIIQLNFGPMIHCIHWYEDKVC